MPNQSSEEDLQKKEQRKERERITKIAIERISSKETDPEEALRILKKESKPEVEEEVKQSLHQRKTSYRLGVSKSQADFTFTISALSKDREATLSGKPTLRQDVGSIDSIDQGFMHSRTIKEGSVDDELATENQLSADRKPLEVNFQNVAAKRKNQAQFSSQRVIQIKPLTKLGTFKDSIDEIKSQKSTKSRRSQFAANSAFTMPCILPLEKPKDAEELSY